MSTYSSASADSYINRGLVHLPHPVTFLISSAGKGVSTGDKAMLSQAKPTCGSSSAQAKPFAGKVFYLDLPSNRIAEMLENDIKDLGGVRKKEKNTFFLCYFLAVRKV